MIKRASDLSTEAAHQLRQGALGMVILDNLIIRGKNPRFATEHFGRTILAIEDLEVDTTPFQREYQLLFANAGRAAYAEEDYAAAESAWEEAIAMDKTDRRTRLRLGVLRMCMGKAKDAELILYGAALRARDHYSALNARALSRPTLAEAVLILGSEAADLYQALGESRLQQQKYEPAIRAFDQCLALDPSRDDAMERRAVAYRESMRTRHSNS